MKYKTEILGFVAGTLTTSAYFPQVLTVWRMAPKPAESTSILMFITILIGITLWITYGVKIKNRVLIIFNCITMLEVIAILTYKFIYG